MNSTLDALTTKLIWQRDELTLHLQASEKKSQELLLQIQEIEEALHDNNFGSLIINPELEINRLNFITQKHKKKDELTCALQDQHLLEIKLKDKLQRVKTELKMLEKYLEKQAAAEKIHHLQSQQHAMDEWVLQKREQ